MSDEAPTTLAKVEKQNVANILKKLIAGKVLTEAEKRQVIDYQAAQAKTIPTGRSYLINPRQAEFARLVVAGATYADAFRQAYKPRKDLKPAFLGSQAWRVATRPSVAAEIARLRAKSEAKTILSLNDRLGILAADAQAAGSGPAYMAARARVIEVYNKTAGDNPAERTETTLKGDPNAPLTVATVELTKSEKLAMLRAKQAARKIACTPPQHSSPSPQV